MVAPMHALIAGGGVGGLALALMLRPIDHERVRKQPVSSRLRLQDAQCGPSRTIFRVTQINE